MVKETVYGIVPDRQCAEKLVDSLVNAGIASYDISLLSSQKDEFHELTSYERNWREEKRVDLASEKIESKTKAPEGATAGMTAGGLIGGTLGLLAGIGALAIPGAGPFIAAGPILSTLSGIGAGGAVGSIVGALAGFGIPEYEAKQYHDKIVEGGILLAVLVDEEKSSLVKDILIENGAKDVNISQSIIKK